MSENVPWTESSDGHPYIHMHRNLLREGTLPRRCVASVDELEWAEVVVLFESGERRV